MHATSFSLINFYLVKYIAYLLQATLYLDCISHEDPFKQYKSSLKRLSNNEKCVKAALTLLHAMVEDFRHTCGNIVKTILHRTL
jgi:hypothetical protein